MDTFISLLYPLSLTLLIEYPIVQIVWLIITTKKERTSKFLLLNGKLVIIPAIIVNVLTNPAINLFARHMFFNTTVPQDTIWRIITALEVVVFIVEGILYKYLLKTSWIRGMYFSLSANLVSYLFSFII